MRRGARGATRRLGHHGRTVVRPPTSMSRSPTRSRPRRPAPDRSGNAASTGPTASVSSPSEPGPRWREQLLCQHGQLIRGVRSPHPRSLYGHSASAEGHRDGLGAVAHRGPIGVVAPAWAGQRSHIRIHPRADLFNGARSVVLRPTFLAGLRAGPRFRPPGQRRATVPAGARGSPARGRTRPPRASERRPATRRPRP